MYSVECKQKVHNTIFLKQIKLASKKSFTSLVIVVIAQKIIMEITTTDQNYPNSKYLTEEDIKLIISKHRSVNNENVIVNYEIRNASDKMLGFLCDYWKLQINLGPENKILQYFIKLMSVTNAAKAEMVKDLRLFEKELYFYAVIKPRIEIPDLKPWSAEFVTGIKNSMVFEDMNSLQYWLRDKFKRFDMAHCFEALRTLTRFHASTVIYEEKRSKELGRKYSLNEDFHEQLHETGYVDTDNWFIKCMNAALDAIKLFSNYTEEELKIIESCWSNVWSLGLAQSNQSTEYRNVICHRDLWNNNLMFHYKTVGQNLIPDHCVMVDFQAARYQPPAGDVMLLLYCNLDPKLREENMEKFLDFYLEELNKILVDYDLESSIINKEKFFESAAKQRQWAIVVCACLMPQFWIDDDLTTRIFCDTKQFNEILSENKSAFVIKMMQSNPDYKEKVMSIFDEIVQRYCLQN